MKRLIDFTGFVYTSPTWVETRENNWDDKPVYFELAHTLVSFKRPSDPLIPMYTACHCNSGRMTRMILCLTMLISRHRFRLAAVAIADLVKIANNATDMSWAWLAQVTATSLWGWSVELTRYCSRKERCTGPWWRCISTMRPAGNKFVFHCWNVSSSSRSRGTLHQGEPPGQFCLSQTLCC